MLRLRSESSRPYPGRPVPKAFRKEGTVRGNMHRYGTGVSRGHSRRRKVAIGGMATGNEPGKNPEGSPRRRAEHEERGK